MNKTFKRVLASMLAILMIICSMPFTVFAAENNRKWWIDDGVDPSKITAEPQFEGYNSDVISPEHPEGSAGAEFGAVDVLDGSVFYNEDLRDHYKPVFGLTISDIGTKGNINDIKAKYRSYYTYDPSCTFEATQGNVLDPDATLAVGQRIAITSEFGGIDILNCGQIFGLYNTEYLKPGYYNGEITGTRDKWSYVNEATNSKACTSGSQFYNTLTNTNISFPSCIVWDGEMKIAFANGLFTSGGAEVMTYIGTPEERPWQAKYGIVAGTAYFEVQKECKIRDVFSLRGDDGGTLLEPIYRFDSNVNETNYLITIDDFANSFANAAVVWTRVGGSEECTHANTTSKTEVTTAATCETKGVETVTVTCNDCGEVVSTTTNEIPALGHKYEGALTPAGTTQHTVACVNEGCTSTKTVDCTFTVVDHKDATLTDKGYDKYACACGNSYTEEIPVLTCEHKNTTESKETTKVATCTETGIEVVTVTCNDCGKVVSTTENTIPMIPHTEKVVPGKAATCTATGLTDGKVCEVCGKVIVAQEEIPMKAHTEVEIPAVPATCTEGGKTAGVKCSVCGTIITAPQDTDKLGHDFTVEVPGSAVAPTVDAPGKEADMKCSRCDAVQTGAVIPALASYEITVEATDLGTVTLNGADVTDGATVKVEAGSTVTLTAEAAEGSKFLGWTANGLTTVSTDTTFTTVALANVTYTPVFEKADAASFTVVFADAYGNIVSSQVVTDASQLVIPAAPARSGYVAATENGWSMTDAEIKALTSSATVIALYELAETEGYTVTATGATITGDGIEATADVVTGVAYDTLVTVYKEGAKGWSVNGVTVAYGDTYSFYVGKDIEVVAVMDGVTAVPMVANVGVNEIGNAGALQAQFIATRTMADGYTYIDSGFVYGKGDLGEITLFDVDGSAVKAAYTKTASEQFSVTYGLRAQSGTITARAFIAYANADGEVTVTYAAPMTYQYK